MSDRVVNVVTEYGAVSVQLLSGETMVIPKALFRLHPLRPGDSILVQTYWEQAAQDEYEQGMQKAVRALSVRERTEKELERSLQRAGYRPETIDRIVAYLSQRRYVDDDRYAMQLAQTQQHRQSTRRIGQSMLQRGIGRETVENALSHVDADAQEALLAELVAKYLRRHPDLSTPQERNKAIASFLRRGFDADQVREAIRKVLEA